MEYYEAMITPETLNDMNEPQKPKCLLSERNKY